MQILAALEKQFALQPLPCCCHCLQETSFLVHRTQPLLLAPNKEGYTVMAMSWCPKEMPQDSWRLSVLSQQPLQAWTQLPGTRQDLFEGDNNHT